MRVVSVAEMRELERRAFDAGTPEAELQRRAGAAVADTIVRIRRSTGSVVALVGPGNNGRDAWVAAERLRAFGWDACLHLTPRHALTDAELHTFERQGGRVVEQQAARLAESIRLALERCSVAVDGLLGIGALGPPRPPLIDVIEEVNAWRARTPDPIVVAVDTPSGLDADTGIAPGAVMRADVTVVLGGAKRGLLTPAAAQHTGQLVFADIGIADGPDGATEVVTDASVRGALAATPPDAHKGALGRLLVVAGSERYVGAANLVCAAGLRAGAGIVTLACPRWLRDVVAGGLPELTYLPLPDGGPAIEPDRCAALILDALPSFNALALGPGLSTEGGVGAFVESALRGRGRRTIPAVVDADGLNALAARTGWTEWIGPDVVMTPHRGELRRLAPQTDTADNNVDTTPWEAVRPLARAWGVTLVLKGAFTAIGSDDRAWVHAKPNPALATAGTGDVLTGIVGGLLARGMQPAEAARLAVWVHGTAGDLAGRGRPAGGLAASDLLAEIPLALAEALPKGAARRV
ncbi:MAG: NAD(P)H-hydrate dehydratase [Chloroflexi bacterium]|nr:NAD(P)H-hydrate dehydratase [Chloroflexota bacterium]